MSEQEKLQTNLDPRLSDEANERWAAAAQAADFTTLETFFDSDSNTLTVSGIKGGQFVSTVVTRASYEQSALEVIPRLLPHQYVNKLDEPGKEPLITLIDPRLSPDANAVWIEAAEALGWIAMQVTYFKANDTVMIIRRLEGRKWEEQILSRQLYEDVNGVEGAILILSGELPDSGGA